MLQINIEDIKKIFKDLDINISEICLTDFKDTYYINGTLEGYICLSDEMGAGIKIYIDYKLDKLDRCKFITDIPKNKKQLAQFIIDLRQFIKNRKQRISKKTKFRYLKYRGS